MSIPQRITPGQPVPFPCWLWKSKPTLSVNPLWLYFDKMPYIFSTVSDLVEAGSYTHFLIAPEAADPKEFPVPGKNDYPFDSPIGPAEVDFPLPFPAPAVVRGDWAAARAAAIELDNWEYTPTIDIMAEIIFRHAAQSKADAVGLEKALRGLLRACSKQNVFKIEANVPAAMQAGYDALKSK